MFPVPKRIAQKMVEKKLYIAKDIVNLTNVNSKLIKHKIRKRQKT